MRVRDLGSCALVVAVLVTAPAQAQGGCSPGWEAEIFGLNGLGQPPNAMVTHDDGSGLALYVGLDGSLGSGDGTIVAGASRVRGIARRGPQGWESVGGGISGVVTAFQVFDDGSGTALYAGGAFSGAGASSASDLARWDGTSWSAVGSGPGGPVTAMALYDDGAGSALFVGCAGPSSSLARWDGTAWSFLPVSGAIDALTIYDDGTGPALYGGGPGGASGAHFFRYDGSSVTLPGGGVPSLPACGPFPPCQAVASIESLAVFDDGFGPALFAGGHFAFAGGFSAANIARWDGSAWAPVGGGVTFVPSPSTCTFFGGCPRPEIRSLAVYDDGAGPALFAGGVLNQAQGVPVSGIARWDGAAWSSPGAGLRFLDPPACSPFSCPISSVSVLSIVDWGSGPELVVGGDFDLAGAGPATRLARWNGASWRALHGGVGSPVNTNERLGFPVTALGSFDDGTGLALYAGGLFSAADGSPAIGVGRWQGGSWSSLDVVSGYVKAFEVFDDGTGSALYAGGTMSAAGGVITPNIARWSGAAWSDVGGGVGGTVHALEVFDGGNGAVLYAGGAFTQAGGISAQNIARWDGSSWLPVGLGVDGPVHALATYDDGTGPALYVGGAFATAGGLSASLVARWDGTSWASLGSGFTGRVNALTVFDDGSGPALYAGGHLASPASGAFVARWDGSAWTPLPGVPSFFNIEALISYDDGSGPKLVIASTGILASWHPATGWSTPYLGAVDGTVCALTVADLGDGPRLYAAGDFLTADGSVSVGLARSGCVGPGVGFHEFATSTWSTLYVDNNHLVAGTEYYNLFSLEPCPGGPGGGPWLGLCAADPGTLINQLSLPLGALPFHFIATGPTQSWSAGFSVPAGLTFEAVCIEVVGGGPVRVSRVVRITTQGPLPWWPGGPV